jgi:cell division protein FtsL
MSKNKLIVKPEILEKKVEPLPPKPERKTSKAEETIKGIAGGDKLVNVLDRKNFPFVLFIVFLGMIFITNTYYATNTLRKIEKTKAQIKELRYDYVSTKRQLIELSRRNKVMERLGYDNKKLKESKVPPFRLEIKQVNDEASN